MLLIIEYERLQKGPPSKLYNSELLPLGVNRRLPIIGMDGWMFSQRTEHSLFQLRYVILYLDILFSGKESIDFLIKSHERIFIGL